MTAYILTIGDEILIGQTVNTNAAWLGEVLSKSGIDVVEHKTISDKRETILESLKETIGKYNFIFITGGLGPTKDDITKYTLCEFFDDELVRDEAVLQKVEAFFEERGREILEVNQEQADVPSKAKLIPNNHGTAPGMWFMQSNSMVFSLPGVPYEMKAMITDYIMPTLKNEFNFKSFYSQTVLTQGMGESFLAEKIKDWEQDIRDAGLELAYLPSPGIVKLRITSHKGDVDRIFIEEKIKEIKKRLPKLVYGTNKMTLNEAVGTLLKYNKLSIASAESCTGGNIAQSITSVPGSSNYFNGSVIAYQNDIKSKVLGVNPKHFNTVGAVSQEVVEEMATGVKDLMGTDYAIATSGVAGPDGGSPEKPVGTVWIAVAGPNKVVSKKFLFGNNRERNIQMATQAALNFVRITILDL